MAATKVIPSKGIDSHVWLVHSLFKDGDGYFQSGVANAFTTLDGAKKYVEGKLPSQTGPKKGPGYSTDKLAYFTDLADFVVVAYLYYSKKLDNEYYRETEEDVESARRDCGNDFVPYDAEGEVPSVVEDGKLKSVDLHRAVYICNDGSDKMTKFVDDHSTFFGQALCRYAIVKQNVHGE